MGDQETAVSPFFGTWVPEFGRAIEMFFGERATVNYKAAGAEQPAGSVLWWKQTFVVGEPSAEQTGSAWIGAPEVTWSVLGASLGTDGAEARKTYAEMLTQSLTSAAVVLSKELQNKITCGEGVVDSSPAPAGCERVTVSIGLKGKELPVIVAAIDPAFAKQLSAPVPASSAALSAAQQTVPAPTNLTPLLERVIDLELPFSVVLGHATLPIRSVIQLTAGSLIELDQYVDQPVELRVQGAVVARCEVVTVGGNYGIRILEIISPEERLNLRHIPRKAKIAAR